MTTTTDKILSDTPTIKRQRNTYKKDYGSRDLINM